MKKQTVRDFARRFRNARKETILGMAKENHMFKSQAALLDEIDRRTRAEHPDLPFAQRQSVEDRRVLSADTIADLINDGAIVRDRPNKSVKLR